jgi:hypothetical protein
MSESFKKGTGLISWLAAMLAFLTGCSSLNEERLQSFPGESRLVTAFDTAYSHNFDIMVPPTTLDMFACIDCHKGLKVNTARRVLTQTHKDFVFDHPGFQAGSKWCYYCHSTGAFDKLILDNGSLISYAQSYSLCVQCHPQNYREWEMGIHGKRIGEWNGVKQHLSCINCHNSHSPSIKPVEPKKPPIPPSEIKLKIN